MGNGGDVWDVVFFSRWTFFGTDWRGPRVVIILLVERFFGPSQFVCLSAAEKGEGALLNGKGLYLAGGLPLIPDFPPSPP